MNARITTITLATILAGSLTASGHPQGRRQQRPGTAVGQQQQICPACGAPRIGRRQQQMNQGRRAQQQSPRRQQLSQQGGRPQGPQYAPQQQHNGQRAFQNSRQQPLQQQRYGQRQLQGHPQQQFHGRGQQTPRQFTPQQRQKFRQGVLKRFDRDGDGQLSEEERQAVKSAVQERRRDTPADSRKGHKRKKGGTPEKQNDTDVE